MLCGRNNFYLGPHDMGTNFRDFQRWAYSNIDTPVIRGQLIEFFLVQHLRKHGFDIAASIIKKWTTDNPTADLLNQSTAPFYATQPHMDQFDLQLHWGLTYEFKTTDSSSTWTLNRTCRWNPFTGTHSKQKIFPAQYYVLAFLQYEKHTKTRQFQFPEPTFYVKTGRQLDLDTKIANPTAEHKKAGKTHYNSIGFNPFTKGLQEVSFGELVQHLAALAIEEKDELIKKIDGNWKITPPERTSGKQNFIPVVFADGRCAWYEEIGSKLIFSSDILSLPRWKSGVQAEWRDWESLGFRYVEQNYVPGIAQSAGISA